MKRLLLVVLIFSNTMIYAQKNYELNEIVVNENTYVTYVKENMERLDGVLYRRFSDGKIEAEANYKNGWRDGITKYWWKNRQLKWLNSYKDGRHYGENKGWYESGELKSISNYNNKNQRYVGKSFSKNGQLSYLANYYGYDINGPFREAHEVDGISKWWYDDGQLKWIYNYKKGKIDGEVKRWYNNGQLECIKEYKNDILILAKCWDQNGNIVKCK